MQLPWNRSNLLQVWTWPQLWGVNMFCLWPEQMSPGRLLPLFKFLRVFFAVWEGSFMISLCITVGITISTGKVNFFLLFAMIPTLVGTFNMFALIQQGDKIKRAMNILDDLMKDAHLQIDSNLEALIRKRYCRNWIVSILYLAFNIVLTAQWLVVPLWIAFTSGKKILIAPTWPPFYSNWSQFAASYIYQVVSVSHLGLGVGLFPSLYASISEGILIQFEILKFYFNSIKCSEQVNKRLRVAIVHHDTILEVCYLLRDSSKGALLTQTMLTSLAFCLGIFEISYDPDVVFQNIAEVVIELFIAMFIYCWYCNEVSHKSSEVVTDSYNASWEDWGVADRRSLVIVASMAQKPLIFGGIIKVNLDTFINVFKTGFGYYNFMEAMHAGE